MKLLLDEILRKKKGHWGFIEPAYSWSRLPQFIEAIRGDREIRLLSFDCGTLKKELRSDNRDGCLEEIKSLIEADIKVSCEAHAQSVCFILSNFHLLPVQAQCNLLSLTRGIREATNDISFQTIVHGHWNRYRVQKYWNTYEALSPVPDQRNVRALDGPTFNDMLDRLSSADWIPNPCVGVDRTAIEALIEFTGGDTQMIEEVLAVLKARGHGLKAFQETRVDVAISEGVGSDLISRIQRLSEGGLDKVRVLLNAHSMIVDPRDPLIEDLRLLGIVKLTRNNDLTVASISSPLMDLALRQNWDRLSKGLAPMYSGGDLVRPLHSINRHAYQLVLEIETLLRNWLVSALSGDKDHNWKLDVKGIKVPGCNAEAVSQEILQLGRTLVEALYPQLDLSVIDKYQSSTDGSDRKKGVDRPSMVDAIDSAEEWMRRQSAQPSIRLAELGLPSFFTTGSLINIYMAGKGKVHDVVAQAFPSREELRTFLSKFNVIRSAVAHNQDLALSSVEELAGLHRELCMRCGSASIKRLGHN